MLMQQIVTGNRLIDGEAVFRAVDGSWQRDVNAARVYTDAVLANAAHAAALAEVTRVLDVNLIDVVVEGDRIIPTRLREKIRAFGPTVKSDHRTDQKSLG
jgi:Protein of unknown function (DUF2849)